jgi:hypothetical protein
MKLKQPKQQSQVEAQSSSPGYDYLVVRHPVCLENLENTEYLNELGASGWRLVSSLIQYGYVFWYFERRLTDETKTNSLPA